MMLARAIKTTVVIAKPPPPLLWFLGAKGPTIFLIGATFSLFPTSRPFFMPGRPSMLRAFEAAQYLSWSSEH